MQDFSFLQKPDGQKVSVKFLDQYVFCKIFDDKEPSEAKEFYYRNLVGISCDFNLREKSAEDVRRELAILLSPFSSVILRNFINKNQYECYNSVLGEPPSLDFSKYEPTSKDKDIANLLALRAVDTFLDIRNFRYLNVAHASCIDAFEKFSSNCLDTFVSICNEGLHIEKDLAPLPDSNFSDVVRLMKKTQIATIDHPKFQEVILNRLKNMFAPQVNAVTSRDFSFAEIYLSNIQSKYLNEELLSKIFDMMDGHFKSYHHPYFSKDSPVFSTLFELMKDKLLSYLNESILDKTYPYPVRALFYKMLIKYGCFTEAAAKSLVRESSSICLTHVYMDIFHNASNGYTRVDSVNASKDFKSLIKQNYICLKNPEPEVAKIMTILQDVKNETCLSMFCRSAPLDMILRSIGQFDSVDKIINQRLMESK